MDSYYDDLDLLGYKEGGMPPRNKNDSKLLVHWENDFKKRFKMANNDPYPLWYEEK